MDNTIIRKYDIRGIVGKDLQINDGYEIGRKFGQTVSSVCIGYDSRIASPSIEKELIRGLTLSGANVTRIGLCSSPMLYTATQIIQADLGIMITASHNPSKYNGFKFFSSKKTYSDQEIREVTNNPIKNSTKIGSLININIYSEYIRILKSVLKNNTTQKLKMAWDCGNSPVSGILRHIETILSGHTHIIVNNSIDGTFPLHDPDPIERKNLAQLIDIVQKNKCDLGIALDGDGDRICLIDNRGNIVSNDHLFMIFAREVLEKYPQSKVIANIKMSMKAHDFVNKLGGQVIICATGHSLIKKKMLEEKAKFAGELSGHFFFSELGFDDGMYSAIKAINVLFKKKQSLSQIIEDLPKLYITHEVKIAVEDEKKFQIIELIKKMLEQQNITFSELDGIKVMNDDNKGWWLLRVSNTQNCITARCEGNTLEDFELTKKVLFYYIDKVKFLNCNC
ncbi:phosphomannomutase/phosphoglucomutase [Wolbachia endosymbiont of Dirofilaria (Dirofilaria) immitis]|uniref:phosphomannomutase/phosphoglucomutase n=1 Tax=Wolbachia endosymbiont of Dirofilaria (Dirofilaria) immitis TaxID=1812115 RepID=UPI00158A15C4|nr:phosphomannomutase/phosphoglucomutase [Wolbachia endosymbiont of Dirofilaria (Dirofilaria) immitis]QKX02191.1 phosphomannomutase/phosphoglucomutase [Wolbachia endosymbiont of Dirofilaria (Dirofilaria) immitis]